MENYTITKKQILELAKRDVNRYQIKEWFPEAFKKELEIGKWYKSNADRIVFRTGDSGNYGFCRGMIWKENLLCYDSNNWKEATPQEVETALIAEAKKRGYKKGNFKCPLRRESEFSENYNEWYFQIRTNSLFTESAGKGGACIFEDGKWAEISHPGKQVISMKKALKIIAKKLKVSPEDIKIEQYEKTL